ncbi:MAG: ComF family protein [Phycisphaerae bacterium]|nr:ComF family protein [Phycisphaerae bacterium]
MSPMHAVHWPFRWLGELVYPRACALCGTSLSPEAPWACPHCTSRFMDDLSRAFCPRCGRVAEPYMVSPDGCRHCKGQRVDIDALVRVGTYEGPAGELVLRYKLKRHQELDAILGTLVADAIAGQVWAGQIEALIPVPITLWERWGHGFWPVGLLVRAAARKLNVPVWRAAVVRGKKRRQAELPASARAANVRGIFRIKGPEHLAGRTICVVDDVATTNATINEMAKVLKKAGARAVFAAVVAKTTPEKIFSKNRAQGP